jgi:competence protein ComEA
MDLTANEAEAIVRIRDQRGAFKTVDDVKQVPNLDAAKIDAKKDLLVF